MSKLTEILAKADANAVNTNKEEAKAMKDVKTEVETMSTVKTEGNMLVVEQKAVKTTKSAAKAPKKAKKSTKTSTKGVNMKELDVDGQRVAWGKIFTDMVNKAPNCTLGNGQALQCYKNGDMVACVSKIGTGHGQTGIMKVTLPKCEMPVELKKWYRKATKTGKDPETAVMNWSQPNAPIAALKKVLAIRLKDNTTKKEYDRLAFPDSTPDYLNKGSKKVAEIKETSKEKLARLLAEKKDKASEIAALRKSLKAKPKATKKAKANKAAAKA